MAKNLPAMQETWVRTLDQEDSLEKGMTIHSSVLARRIPRTEEPSRLQSIGLQSIGHDWATNTFTFMISTTRVNTGCYGIHICDHIKSWWESRFPGGNTSKLSPLGEVRVIQMKQKNRGPDFSTENGAINELMWFNTAEQRTQRGAGAMREKARKGNRSTYKEACGSHASARTWSWDSREPPKNCRAIHMLFANGKTFLWIKSSCCNNEDEG